MENNENFVAEQVAENVEQTTEQTPKTYTQEEVDAIVGKRVARTEAKITKKFERKYGQLEEVLKAGTGKENVEEMTDTFRQFYEQKGIQFPKKPTYSDSDIKLLAKADAEEFINAGYEDVVEEVERLADIGVENMTEREKAMFTVLAEHRQNTERGRELSKIGVTEDVYNSEEFKKFADQFKPTIPLEVVYDNYRKTQPQKEFKTTGSMKNVSTSSGIKDYYSPEEAKKFSREDLRKNPALMDKIVESMSKWKK